LLDDVADALASAKAWDTEPLEIALRSLAERRGVAAGKLFQPLRVALTGLTVSPGIFEVLVAMGRKLALARIADALNWLRNSTSQSS
jgi:glutamyl-tRNA synthetase